MWASIASGGATRSARDWVLLEAHSTPAAVHGNALIVGDLKVLTYGGEDPVDEDGWWPPPGEDVSATPYTVHCAASPGVAPRVGPAPRAQCQAPVWCLFNITADPCEYDDLASSMPHELARLVALIQPYQLSAVAPNYGTGCEPTIVCVDAPRAPTGKVNAVWPCDGRYGNVSQPCAAATEE